MATLGLELNDAGLVAVRSEAKNALAAPESPGYALVEGERLVLGQEARDRARLKPRFTHTRFWDAIDTAPLARPFSNRLSRADLAHAHLSEFWKSLETTDEAMLAVPGWYSLDQLGLILGLTRSCDIPVGGMIDSALAAAATVGQGSALLHLDLHLHRVAASLIRRSDQLVRAESAVEESAGLVPLQDAWATHIAECFVRQTRYDPLHRAESEQTLYGQLPSWLDRLCVETRITASMEVSGKSRAIELERDHLAEAAGTYYSSILALASSIFPHDERVTLLLSHRIARLPGLIDRLRRDLSDDVLTLPDVAAAKGALGYERPKHRSSDDDALTFLTRLDVPPADGAPRLEATAATPNDAYRMPSHVLFDGRALSIEPGPFLIGLSIEQGARGLNVTGETAGVSRYHCSLYCVDERIVVEDHSKFGSFVNEKRVHERTTVSSGDRLRLGTPGIELQLIEVEP